MRLKYYRQLPVKGGRPALPSCVLREIHNEVERTARKFKVSKSFVVATALAAFFDIEEQEDFRDVSKRSNHLSKLSKR